MGIEGCTDVCKDQTRLTVGIWYIIPFPLACIKQLQEIGPMRHIGLHVQHIALPCMYS